MIQKIGQYLFITLSTLALANTVYATSGACSWHGGVNCAAGPGSYEQVICNDGWTNSSVSYNSMIECATYGQTPSAYKLDPSAYPCTGYHNADAITGKTYDGIQGAYQKQQGLIAMKIALDDQYSKDLADYGRSIAGSHTPLSAQNSRLQEINMPYQASSDAINSDLQGVEWLLNEMQLCSPPQPTCPSNAYYNNSTNSCYCNSGYTSYGNQCISYSQSCQNKLGLNSYGDKSYCYCSTGYQLNSDKTSCVPIVCPSNSTPTGNSCTCNSGFINSGGQCVAIVTSLSPSVPLSLPASSTPLQFNFIFTKNLKVGDSGEDVVNLQKFLENKGLLILPPGTSEGYFGQLTKQTLVAFQKSVGLPTTGYCGSMTRQVLNKN